MKTLVIASLNKKVNYPTFGILTKREFIDRARLEGWQVKAREMDGYSNGEYNRNHFNRLSGDDQTRYEKKMQQKKTVYSIHPPEGSSFYDITKTEYEYFVSLSN
jgi:hypothetical protein